MNKTLIILNTFYPFARHEDFLANEMEFIDGFDEILIVPNSIQEPKPKFLYEVNFKYKYLINQTSYKNIKFSLLFKIVFSGYFYRELCYLLKRRKLTFNCIKNLVSFLLYSLNSYNTVSNYIKNNCNKKKIYIYSYWMHASAFVACLLKKKYTEIIKVITRCHRFDLYEYHSTDEYIPMRNFIYKNIDEIHSISIDGIEYLTSKEPSLKNKLILSRLGTKDHGFISHIKNKPLKLVSCSWIRPVKRVDLIIDALAECDITLEWTHFGNGEDFNKLIDKANNLRKNNIKIILPGSKCNEEVINAYKENKYDVFINVSSSEGIPVSIMEAMSMGMIIIATAVGGTPEVVDKTNGFLLDPNFSNKELIDILNFINNMDEKEYVKMKLSSRNKWEKSFSADRNYASFYSHLLK